VFWKRQMVYRATSYRTTWKLRFFVSVLLLALPVVTRGWWAPSIGSSLVSNNGFEKPDLILIDNLDTDYLLFEKARDLRREGVGAPILVPVTAAANDPGQTNLVSQEIAQVLIRVARLDTVEFIPTRQIEPITLNVARQVGDFLKGTNIKTVLILTSGFKSKRIHLIFKKVLAEVGIDAYCLPVWGTHRPDNWAESWHGIQEVFLQYVKLGFYRLWVRV
jgi:hypothetical protein